MRLRAFATCSLLVLTCPGPAAAGNVSGVVWVSPSAARRAAYGPPAASSSRAACARAQRGIAETVVWIDRVPEKVERQLATGGHRWFWQKRAVTHLPVMVQRGTSFTPRVMTVPVGGAVAFRNLDHVYHSLFSVSAAQQFDLGKYPPGRADTVKFVHAGVVNVHCDIHPTELGFVVVVPTHVFARPDSLGGFEFPKLPPGTYTVRAWHPRLGELRREFEVPRRGDVGLQLVL